MGGSAAEARTQEGHSEVPAKRAGHKRMSLLMWNPNRELAEGEHLSRQVKDGTLDPLKGHDKRRQEHVERFDPGALSECLVQLRDWRFENLMGEGA